MWARLLLLLLMKKMLLDATSLADVAMAGLNVGIWYVLLAARRGSSRCRPMQLASRRTRHDPSGEEQRGSRIPSSTASLGNTRSMSFDGLRDSG